MELGVKRHGKPARIEVDTTEKCLVIHHEGGEERLGLFSTTRIEIKGARLIVGSEELDPDLGLERPPTVMDIQEFAKFLKQVAGSASGAGKPNPQTPQGSAVPTRPAVTSNNRGPSVNAEARAHFSRASELASFVEGVAYVCAIASAIAGIAIVVVAVMDTDGVSGTLFGIASGVALGMFGIALSFCYAMVAAYIRGRAAEKGL